MQGMWRRRTRGCQRHVSIGFMVAAALLLGCLLVLAVPSNAEAATIEHDGTWGECTWTIDSDGLLSVFPTDGVSGQLADSRGYALSESEAYFPWYQYRESIKSVTFAEGVVLPENCLGMFHSCSSIASIDARGWNTSYVVNAEDMFFNCNSLKSIDVSGWDTSSVTNMLCMFSDCASLIALDLSSWDVSSVTSIYCMFTGCSSLQSLNVSNWNTSSIASMHAAFSGLNGLESLDVSGWNTSSVTDMGQLFEGCYALSSLDVSSWDTSSVVDMFYMFFSCGSLSALDLSGWDTGSVADMRCMFMHCESLVSILVGDGWSIGGLEESWFADDMFYNCPLLVGGNGTVFDEAHTGADYAHVDAPSAPGYLTYKQGQSGEVVSGIWGTCPWEITGDGVLTVYPGVGASQEGKDSSPWGSYADTITSVVFSSDDDQRVVAPKNSSMLLYGLSEAISIDVSGLDTSRVTDMTYLFCDCSSLESLDLRGWNTSRVKDMSFMFDGCSNLMSLNVSRLNVSSVTRMEGAFIDCSLLSSLDLSTWNTSSLLDMGGLFCNCYSLEEVSLADWNTSSVENMWLVFGNCYSLSELDLSGWNTSSVENMNEVFFTCSSLETIYVGSGWTTAAVTQGGDMFNGCRLLVGGNGTAYNPAHRDFDYARVDAPGAPGYLTGVSSPADKWVRLPGNDRFDTSARISRAAFPEDGSSYYAVVAYGWNFPDALVASSVAGAYGCPVLLTDGKSLSAACRDELVRLGVRHVFVMGSSASISDMVLGEIAAALGIDPEWDIERVAGSDRQGTSVDAMNLVMSACPETDTVVVTNGTNYPDALSMGPWCYANHVPMLLTGWDHRLTDAQIDALLEQWGIYYVIILGDGKSVDTSVDRQLRSLGYYVERLGGTDRFDTGWKIADWTMRNYGMGVTNVVATNGWNFPDALAASALCGQTGSVMVLVGTDAGSWSRCADRVLGGHGDEVELGYVLGKENSVSEATYDHLVALTQ